MNIIPTGFESTFMTFFFVYVRVSAAVFSMPILSNTSVPRSIQAGISFFVAVVLMGSSLGLDEASTQPLIPAVTQTYHGLVDFSLAVAAEGAIGIALGFLAQMFLHTIGLAGELIGLQSGFSAASVFDPITGQDIFLIAQINTWIGTLIFLLIDGPGKVLSILADSFHIMSPGEGIVLSQFGKAGFETLLYSEGRRIALASMMFKIGVQLAAPMIAAMILIGIAEAFIARTVPQLNIMVISFAVRITISLLFLFSLMSGSIVSFSNYLNQLTPYARSLLQRMAPY